jgi:ABC-type antimicrobial peptide transport system permease subunit
VRGVVRVAWYRFRGSFGSRWGGYLSVVLLVGLLGGLAMGVVAAARRTQSSFPTYLASTNPSNLSVFTGTVAESRLAHLPDVRRVEGADVLNVLPLGSNGAPKVGPSTNEVFTVGSDGLLFDVDRVTAIEGRMADPNRANEAVVTSEAAQLLGLHVGQDITVGFYTNDQTSLPRFGTAKVRPTKRADLRVVGIVVSNSDVVQDDAQKSISALVLVTPALTKQLVQCCGTGLSEFGLQLEHGGADVSTVETEVDRALPTGTGFYFVDPTVIETEAQRAIKPEAIALGVFGGICGLAVLLIASQIIARQRRLFAGDLGTLRALGASPSALIGDGLIGVVGAIVVGSLLAGAVAVALSPLGPLGPVRPVDPSSGVAFDWTVLSLGTVVLLILLSASAVISAYRTARHLSDPIRQRSRERPSGVAATLATARLPESAVMGVRFVLEPGGGRNSVPVRSATLGAALAVLVVVATVTFGASLNTLVSHPALYGWNWNYELESAEGGGYIPGREASQLLSRDPDVAAWTGVYFDSLRIDGQTVPMIGESPPSPVGPPVQSGHALQASNQIVLGATSLADLHKRVGGTVQASYGTSSTETTLRIVGTATMPAVGPGLGLHLSMGIGAVVSDLFIPAGVRNPTSGPPGPNAYFVRLKNGSSSSASFRSLQRIVSALDSDPNAAPISVLSVQRPAEIVNYRTMGSTPAFLSIGLAAGAVVALGLTLIASVRRRRRDFAVLRTLGFTGRQLGSVVAWQSSVAVAIGTIIGVPLGIILGRFLWNLFAHEINVIPAPTVPVVLVVLIVVGAMALANIVAAVPGRIAARTAAALLLRAE